MSFTDVRDFTGPQAAINAANAPSFGSVLLDAATVYDLNPGLVMGKPVNFRGHGAGSVLRINTSASPGNQPFRIESATDQTYTTTGAITAGQRTFTLNSVAGLSVGDQVLMLMGEDPFDPNEEITRMFNTVEGIAGLDVTFAIGQPEAIPASTHEIRTFTSIVEGARIGYFALDRAPGIVSDGGIILEAARNIIIEDIYAIDVSGSVVSLRECENISVNGIYNQRADGSLHGSAGRTIEAWGVRNVRFKNIESMDVDNASVFIESQCRNVVIDGLLIQRRAGLTAGQAIIHIAGGSTGIVIKNYTFNSATSGIALNVVQGSQVRTENASLLNGNVAFPLATHSGTIYTNAKDYGVQRHHYQQFTIPINQAPLTITLPPGLYKSITINVSSVTGILSWFVLNGTGGGANVFSELIAGQPVTVGKGNLDFTGSNHPFNENDAKRFDITTDGTVPANTTAQIELEYWEP